MTSNSVAIIDYGLCNLHSVVNACKYVGLNPIVTSDDSKIIACDGAILPGVGAFGQAIKKIRGRSLDKVILNSSRVASHLWVFVWACNYYSKKARSLENSRAWVFCQGRLEDYLAHMERSH